MATSSSGTEFGLFVGREPVTESSFGDVYDAVDEAEELAFLTDTLVKVVDMATGEVIYDTEEQDTARVEEFASYTDVEPMSLDGVVHGAPVAAMRAW